MFGINYSFNICQDVQAVINGPGSKNVHKKSGQDDQQKVAKFIAQSGKETTNDSNIVAASTSISQQNVQFRDQNPSYKYEVIGNIDPTRRLQDSSDADLGNFFSRPIKIFSTDWSTSSILAFDIDPWSLYFDNVRVVNRTSNFNLLRSTLNIKIVINGNGFQYGRAIASYLPLYAFDQLSSLSSLVTQDLVQTSQLPHVYLDPTTSTGGEIKCPFFYHLNYAELPTSAYSDLGRLFVRSLNALKHANGASDVVTVSVFAWASDVSLSVLTSREPDTLLPQSGKESEVDVANKTGIVSGPATAIMKMSNALAVIPAIAPFALATANVAAAVAGAAKTFGYCRPTVTKNPDPMRLFPISQLATTNTPDTALKLTVDDKQELSIDPRIAGIGPEDPLSIKEIAKRESYLTKFTWSIGTPSEQLLWNTRLSPVTWAESPGITTAYHFPACCMAALPFKYWTGSMKFRFQIVCSAFHKGRLKFVYDPQFNNGTEYNVNYLEVVDIADTQDFTIEIGNGQNKTLLDHHLPGVDSVTQMYSNTNYFHKEQGNGVLGVYVVNELTTPNSTINNDIEVNVFVSMGSDFEVFVPDDQFQNFVFKPQVGMETLIPESQDTAEPSAPQQSMSDKLGPSLQDNSMINLVYTGESIMSFRPLLKRYNFWRREAVATPTQTVRIAQRLSNYPFLRGNVRGAIDMTGVGSSYNYCNTILLHWVVAAHQGWRGSIRYKILTDVARTNNVANISSKFYVQRGENVGVAPSYTKSVISVSDYVSPAAAAYEALGDFRGTKGLLFATDAINPSVEFEAPYYSDYR